ncbi:hypothetical protein ACP4OV_019189 [Aristida adscensionis]
MVASCFIAHPCSPFYLPAFSFLALYISPCARTFTVTTVRQGKPQSMEPHCVVEIPAPPPSPLFRPLPVPASGGPARSHAEHGVSVHQMLGPAPAIDGPVFSGAPPERPGNPVIRDPLFGRGLPVAGLVTTAWWAGATWTVVCSSGCFCDAPALLIEGFCYYSDEDRRRRRVAAGA